jgi:hypothetical protein
VVVFLKIEDLDCGTGSGNEGASLVEPKNKDSNSNYLFQIRKLHMVLFKLEMIQSNNKLFYTEKKIYTIKSNTIKLP